MNVNHDDMKNILFVQDPGEYRLLDSYMGYIPKVSDKEDLYTKLSEGLSFPVYFGRNWDALCELYLDFYWIDTVDIVIVHEDISKLPAGDFRTYIVLFYNLSIPGRMIPAIISLLSSIKKKENR